MRTYTAHGLTIRSPVPLPACLPVPNGRPDVRVQLGRLPKPPSKRIEGEFGWVVAGAAEAWACWAGVATIRIRNGRSIDVCPDPGVRPRVVGDFLQGMPLALLMMQRSILVLHASTVSAAGRAVAILGAPGWGKSTLAAALSERGLPLVSDDVTAVDASLRVPSPGPRRIKLWPDSARTLGFDPARHPRVQPGLEKRRIRVRGRTSTRRLPLGQVLILRPGRAYALRRVSPQRAMVELIAHTYAAQLLPKRRARAHFLSIGRVAREVPIHRVMIPRSLPALGRIADRLSCRLLNNDL